jgi:hypothetical protein
MPPGEPRDDAARARRMLRGLISAGLLAALFGALAALDRLQPAWAPHGIVPSQYRVAPVDLVPADLAVYAIVIVAAVVAALLPRRRRAVLLAAGALALPIALGGWALALYGFVAVTVAIARTRLPVPLRFTVVLVAWLVLPVLRVEYLSVLGQADTILLAEVWIGLLCSALYLVIERARALPGEQTSLRDDAFYLLAPPRIALPFFQPISQRELLAAERPGYPRKLMWRGAGLAGYALVLAIVAARLDDARPHLPHALRVPIEFLVHYANAAKGIVIAIAAFRLLGYDLPPGFRLPFLSRSYAEFFRRFNHYVRDAVVSLFYFPALGHLRTRLPGRAASIISSYFAILVGSLLLQDLLIPCGISVRPLATAAALLRPRRILAMLTMWTLIVLPNAGIIPKRKPEQPRWRIALQILLVDAVYALLWYVETHEWPSFGARNRNMPPRHS